MNEDIFNFANDASFVRLKAKRGGLVSLADFDTIPTFEIPETYRVNRYTFPSENYAPHIRDAVEKIAKSAEKKGCNPNFFTALYEATLNAHQHGNKLDSKKSVTLVYIIKEDKVRTAIIDEGGQFEADFIPFILNMRLEGSYKKTFHNYYQFSNQEKPATNNGTGTSFMHAYVDDVAYLKSKDGGLVVHLTKTF